MHQKNGRKLFVLKKILVHVLDIGRAFVVHEQSIYRHMEKVMYIRKLFKRIRMLRIAIPYFTITFYLKVMNIFLK